MGLPGTAFHPQEHTCTHGLQALRNKQPTNLLLNRCRVRWTQQLEVVWAMMKLVFPTSSSGPLRGGSSPSHLSVIYLEISVWNKGKPQVLVIHSLVHSQWSFFVNFLPPPEVLFFASCLCPSLLHSPPTKQVGGRNGKWKAWQETPTSRGHPPDACCSLGFLSPCPLSCWTEKRGDCLAHQTS